MPLDANNIPFSRSTSFQKKNTTKSQGSRDNNLNTTFNIENLLLEEFNYASVTAYHSMEERARQSNLYFTLMSTIFSGVVAILVVGSARTFLQPLIGALLILGGLLSIYHFLGLIRVRQAWRESVICMNVIKEFYLQQFHHEIPHIERAFRWRLKTIPAGERLGSVTAFTGAIYASIGGSCFAGAAFVIANNVPILSNSVYPYMSAVVIFAIFLLLNVVYFRHSLNVHSEWAAIEEEAEELGKMI